MLPRRRHALPPARRRAPQAPAAPKRQTLSYKNGYAVPLPLGPEDSAAAAAAAEWQTPAPPQPAGAGAAAASTPAAWVPKYVEQDRKVLRFYAYWVEEVAESADEAWRARKCVLLYYLADDTLQVLEPQELLLLLLRLALLALLALKLLEREVLLLTLD